MHSTALIVSLLASLGLSNAISITSPSKDTVWLSGTSGQTIEWTSVSTDPTTFDIELDNQVSRFFVDVSRRHGGVRVA